MIPIRRDLSFNPKPGRVGNWHAQGPAVTQFINAMSIFFPEGERYFIHTVRHYRDRIADPELQKAVIAFIGQEAMHGREHEDYNRLLAHAGLPVEELEAHVRKFFNLLEMRLPASAQLAVTIAQEHFTAIVAELVLTDPRMIAGADNRLSALLRWHSLEEIEHKAVAFEVYETVMGSGLKAYALRTSAMLLTTAGFLGLAMYYQQQLLKADARTRNAQGQGEFIEFMFRSPGLLPRLALPWLTYFHPGFHPWDHDNRHLLKQIDALEAEAETYMREAV